MKLPTVVNTFLLYTVWDGTFACMHLVFTNVLNWRKLKLQIFAAGLLSLLHLLQMILNCSAVWNMLVAVSDGATGVWRGTYPPLFESMGLVISPNLQAHAYGARERPPVSPDFCVPPPPTSKHLAPSLVAVLMSATGCLQIWLNKFPGDSRRDFKKNPGHVCNCFGLLCNVLNLLHLLEHVTMSSNQRSSCTTWGRGKDKKERPIS